MDTRRFPSTNPSLRAFTMVEIAICLAIIGFALAAIVGVLPLGMTVQRENREETVIGQDASVFVNAIRNGELGLDDLTNYVVAITNNWAFYSRKAPSFGASAYTYTNSYTRVGGGWSTLPNYYPMTNGFGIIGLLSTPRFVPGINGFYSNYIVAYVRALSGNASEKVPQTNADVRALAFNYRMICEVAPFGMPNGTNYFDFSWIDASRYPTNSPQYAGAIVYSNIVRNLQTNLYDMRLIFRYPVLPNGTAGNGRQVFRTTTSGNLVRTNMNQGSNPAYDLYHFTPRDYAKSQRPLFF